MYILLFISSVNATPGCFDYTGLNVYTRLWIVSAFIAVLLDVLWLMAFYLPNYFY